MANTEAMNIKLKIIKKNVLQQVQEKVPRFSEVRSKCRKQQNLHNGRVPKKIFENSTINLAYFCLSTWVAKHGIFLT